MTLSSPSNETNTTTIQAEANPIPSVALAWEDRNYFPFDIICDGKLIGNGCVAACIRYSDRPDNKRVEPDLLGWEYRYTIHSENGSLNDQKDRDITGKRFATKSAAEDVAYDNIRSMIMKLR